MPPAMSTPVFIARDSQRLTHVSLCSGIGGIDLAAEIAGFESLAVCEIDHHCRKVLAKNFPGAAVFTDIKDVSAGAFRDRGLCRPTIISAGFPCQPHSVAGKRRADDDERHLWPEVARVLREIKPRWFLGENVRGLLSSADGRVFGDILRDLADMGYRIGWGTFGADEATGATHRRDRVFIVGYLADPYCKGVQRSREHRIMDSQARIVDNKRRQREWVRDASDNRFSDVGNSTGVRCQGCREKDTHEAGGMQDAGKRYSQFPPGPDDIKSWREIAMSDPSLLPALSRQAEAELQIRPVADGVSRRVALKMLGNAVVPAQVLPILQWIADFERG